MENKKFIGYIAIFKRSEKGLYFVEFPDLPGCFSQGTTLEEALCNAQDALAVYYAENEGKLPAATSHLSVRESMPNTIVQMIAVDTNRCFRKSKRIIKKTLTIPEWLNTMAEKYQVNFSQSLKNALILQLRNMEEVSSYDRRILDGELLNPVKKSDQAK